MIRNRMDLKVWNWGQDFRQSVLFAKVILLEQSIKIGKPLPCNPKCTLLPFGIGKIRAKDLYNGL